MPIHRPAVLEQGFAAPASEPLKLGPTEVQIHSRSSSCLTWFRIKHFVEHGRST
jgi:hypothetical protein